jgi:predicted Zn-dependent protease
MDQAIETQKPSSRAPGSFLLRGLIVFCLFILSCSAQVQIPIVADGRIERLVKDEAARIIVVSEDKDRVPEYRIFLSDFPRTDILGMSIGNRHIYISHKLATLALNSSRYRWLLRQTLAHEIAHETAGHANYNGTTSLNRGMFGRGVSAIDVGLPWNVRLRNYSPEKELQADLKGLGYWQKLGWDCRIWVRILENFQAQNYIGDVFHPTEKRLQQARRACASEGNQEQRASGPTLPETASERQALSPRRAHATPQ